MIQTAAVKEDDVLQEGIEHIKRGNFEAAAEHFQAVLRSVNTLRTRGVFKERERMDLLDRLEKRSRLNLSLALLKLRRWNEVLDVCDKILSDDSNHFKASLRKAQALRMLDRFDEAEEWANKISHDVEAQALLHAIDQEKRKRRTVAAALWSGKLGGRSEAAVSGHAGLVSQVRLFFRNFCCKKRNN